EARGCLDEAGPAGPSLGNGPTAQFRVFSRIVARRVGAPVPGRASAPPAWPSPFDGAGSIPAFVCWAAVRLPVAAARQRSTPSRVEWSRRAGFQPANADNPAGI